MSSGLSHKKEIKNSNVEPNPKVTLQNQLFIKYKEKMQQSRDLKWKIKMILISSQIGSAHTNTTTIKTSNVDRGSSVISAAGLSPACNRKDTYCKTIDKSFVHVYLLWEPPTEKSSPKKNNDNNI